MRGLVVSIEFLGCAANHTLADSTPAYLYPTGPLEYRMRVMLVTEVKEAAFDVLEELISLEKIPSGCLVHV